MLYRSASAGDSGSFGGRRARNSRQLGPTFFGLLYLLTQLWDALGSLNTQQKRILAQYRSKNFR